MRTKESKLLIESDVARRVTDMVNQCPKSQREIAQELGYPKSNIITMFKQGVTKVPITKATALAQACDCDPVEFLRLCLAEYAPGMLETVEEVIGKLLSPNERRLIERLRQLNHETSRDLQLTQDGLERFAAFADTYLLEPKSGS